MESMQAAGAESRELEKDDIADYQQAADDQQAEASNFPPVEIKEDEENLWPHLSKQFAFKRKRGNSYIMLAYLACVSVNMDLLNSFQNIKKLSLKLNTGHLRATLQLCWIAVHW